MSGSASVSPPASAPLARRLGLGDAVFIGLGAMIGAGIFSAFSPAATAAGSGLLIGLVVAAVVAFCNATSSAQLAAVYPSAGGTYVYGRERLGPWWGFAAGWSFVIGKTASCAAMALTFAAYAVPDAWARPVAALAVAALVTVNYFGVTRTARLARVIVVVVLAILAVVVASGVVAGVSGVSSSGGDSGGGLAGFSGDGVGGFGPGGLYGVLQAAGLLFFAFAGYARIATMGEEVRDPARTIPRAITIAFLVAVVVYAAIAVVTLGALGPAGVATTPDPLTATVEANGWAWAVPVVTVGAALASLGALLALIAGIGRTTLAMAREGDLPRWLSAVHPRYSVPHRAELVLGAVVVLLVLTVDLRGAIGFSSFGVLLYYFVANLSAFTQPRAERRYWRWLPVLGAVGCVVLVVTLPPLAVVVGAAVLAAGILLRLVVRARSRLRP
ncbi:APC family permease [Herbiconiux sp. CPCC 205763]|uniref:APC family permease n=1 Tax=Herbiconiux aconitum TaxID=2970913 RepID=A0ABT2GMK0_9MICO|nr:APC family permease [Herbiconiux aconitum]MCS5717351.1 APC family permease [Herbiconiux aconitum]